MSLDPDILDETFRNFLVQRLPSRILSTSSLLQDASGSLGRARHPKFAFEYELQSSDMEL